MSATDELARASVLVFVCSGNVVRSAFAELWARHLGCPTPVRSLATTFRNPAIFPETVQALRARGVSADAIRAFRPTHVEDWVPDAPEGALFLAMTAAHRAALAPWPRARASCRLLDPAGDIADPVLEGADFGRTFAHVAALVEGIVRALQGAARGRRA